jgi:hypothetical protein
VRVVLPTNPKPQNPKQGCLIDWLPLHVRAFALCLCLCVHPLPIPSLPLLSRSGWLAMWTPWHLLGAMQGTRRESCSRWAASAGGTHQLSIRRRGLCLSAGRLLAPELHVSTEIGYTWSYLAWKKGRGIYWAAIVRTHLGLECGPMGHGLGSVTETIGIHLVLFGVQNVIFCPYLGSSQ